MKKFIFYLAIVISVLLAAYAFLVVINDITEFQLLVYGLVSLFFLAFGAYGLYAEKLWKAFRAKGKTENLCVEANYHIRNMGFLGRVFLFPFLKIKSSNSFVVSLLGALAWVVIVSILLKAIFG